MPTPSDESLFPRLVPASALPRNLHTTCPPEENCEISIVDDEVVVDEAFGPEQSPSMPLPPSVDPPQAVESGTESQRRANTPPLQSYTRSLNESVRDTPSPVSITESPNQDHERTISVATPQRVTAGPPPIFQTPETPPNVRPMYQHTSSLLRHGSKFKGTQQSDRQRYNVEVEIKHVDMAQSFICGYLRIEGLTHDHPTLTTYFEGEIIGTKYSFHTRHGEWGSNEKVDMQHWNRFPAWRPLARQARRSDFVQKNYAERENIFMRWKEYFLVPDHRVRTISGASFEGFYYICFNQVKGTVSGIYFHSKSEKFQQLELDHVEDRGCLGAMEFR